MTAMHYHVTEGSQGGYMPDSNAVCVTRAQADAYAADLVRELEDNALDAGERIAVDAGYADLIAITYPHRDHDLGRVIERLECDNTDCEVAA